MSEIRRAVPDEWELLKEIRLRALANDPDAFGSTYAREAEFDEDAWRSTVERFAWFVATEPASSEVVGLIAGATFTEGPSREVISMWVADRVRGTGVAESLVSEVKKWAIDDGANELLLWVADDNPRASRFYERIGFIATGETKCIREGSDASCVELRIIL